MINVLVVGAEGSDCQPIIIYLVDNRYWYIYYGLNVRLD